MSGATSAEARQAPAPRISRSEVRGAGPAGGDPGQAAGAVADPGRGAKRGPDPRAGRSNTRRRLARAAAASGLLALAAAGLVMLLPTLLGYQRYVIEGGSMGGALPKGSIAYEEVVPTSTIKPGDVITYRPPGSTMLRTHRVTAIARTTTGERLYRTKGDANPTPDSPAFTLPHDTQARVVMHFPLAGYAVEALAVREIRMAVIGAPALAIAVITLAGLWRDRRRTPAFG